jgi:hypothetical protein
MINLFADVRVYQYLVQNLVEKDAKEKIIVSTLNPMAYIAYHGGEKIINVDLLRTWMCFGNTSKKDLCNSPYGTTPQGALP